MTETTFVATAAAVAQLGEFCDLGDDELIEAQRSIGMHRRQLDLIAARCAAEIARRSSAESGFGGLARRNGFVNAEALVQSVTGSTRADAVKFVRVGELITAPASPVTGEITWQSTLGDAVDDGSLAVDAANAIRVGLGSVSVDGARLVDAVESLVDEAPTIDADQVARRARELRDELDAEGITAREHERRQLRHFGVRRRPDGMVVGSFALSDEEGALALGIYEQATAPKRLGPRFVESSAPVDDRSAPEDPRTRGQKAADAFAGLLRIGVEADPRFVLGHDRPSVRVLVNAEAIAARAGRGGIEGVPDHPISFETVERHLCATGVVGVAFDDDGQSVNVGRDQRLFTRKQRIGLAVRDGGCRFPGCARPPSWTEAHHIDYWARDGGQTDLADGILLCRLHHLLVHDNHWQIRRDRGDYWLIPPSVIDREQRPRPMPSKQPLLRQLLAADAGSVRTAATFVS
jgi:hypothetical protein